MYISGSRLSNKKLTYKCRNKSKSEDYQKMIDMSFQKMTHWFLLVLTGMMNSGLNFKHALKIDNTNHFPFFLLMF